MKKDILAWIDREIERLDRAVENPSRSDTDQDPVPDALRQALGNADTTNNVPPGKQ